MKFSEYQALALRTDKGPTAPGMSVDAGRLIPLLGLAGEAGQLVAEYKKRLRDGPGHVLFVDKVAEELGDILWYVANLASKYDLNLDDIAQQNLRKVSALYLRADGSKSFDADYVESERFPRQFTARFLEITEGPRVEVRTEIGERLVGAALTDNAYKDDGYRYHDVFHIAYAAVLGWSPVLRRLLRLKRRSSPLIDEVEDGGRAAVIEEGIAAVAFDYARKHQFLDGVSDLDTALLETLRGMSAHLEVASQPPSAWRQAVLDGFTTWRELVKNGGGYVSANLDTREVRYLGPPDKTITTAAAAEAE
jgi:NTP pyrophosphatase (non-canonical NTP hydrolase)